MGRWRRFCCYPYSRWRKPFVDFREIGPQLQRLTSIWMPKASTTAKPEPAVGFGIPGDGRSLYMLENHGSGNLTREEILEPAIRIAEEGFYISTYTANAISTHTGSKLPEMQKIYWDENGLPYEGYILKNPDFAKTLRIIAEGKRRLLQN